MEIIKQETQLIPELFDALPESVIWFVPVWKKENIDQSKIIDFEVRYCNDAACEFLQADKSEIIGNTILGNTLVDKDYQNILYTQCLQVWQTGKPIEESYYNESLKKYYNVLRSKAMGGVISLSRDRTAFYKAEQEHQKRAKLLDSILDVSINVMFVLEARRNESGVIIDQVFVKVNKLFTKITGTTEEQVIGQSLLKFFPSALENGLFQTNNEVIETGKALRTEFFYRGDGLNNWFDISMVKLGENELVVTFADITKSRLNEIKLEQLTHRLQTIINSSNAGIITCLPVWNENNEIEDFEFTLINKKVTSYIGQEPSVLIGKRAEEFFPGYKRNGMFEHYKNVFLTHQPFQHDIHYKEDGIDAWIDLMCTRMDDQILITFTDITTLKKLQQQIETSANRLNTVINTSQVGIFTLSPVKDDHGLITDFTFGIVNAAVASYIGQTAENLQGQLASIGFPAYKTNGLFEIYRKTLETGSAHHFNFHYEDGYDVYFDILSTKMNDEVLVTFTDHTAIKKLQLQLESSIEELKRSNTSLEEFAYAASHDLQEPLRKINYFSERLKQIYGNSLTPESITMFERMEVSTSRMRHLIDDLLAYSQVSTTPKSNKLVDLNNIIQQVTSDLETTIQDKNATIITEALPVIKGDPTQLRQMFQNLLSNSLKYSRNDVPPVIEIHSSRINHTINDHTSPFYKIEIIDNGIGFEQEQAQRIFQVFQRLHGKSEYPGTGVGLAIVQKVVANHGGMIAAEGKQNEGAVFTILLPEN